MVGCKALASLAACPPSDALITQQKRASAGEEEREGTFSRARSPLGCIELSCILPSSSCRYHLADSAMHLPRLPSREPARRSFSSKLGAELAVLLCLRGKRFLKHYSSSQHLISFHSNDCSTHEQAGSSHVGLACAEQERSRWKGGAPSVFAYSGSSCCRSGSSFLQHNFSAPRTFCKSTHPLSSSYLS